jgi:DNA-binding response OmpR family regulator
MTQTKTSVSHRVLLVDDDEAVRSMMTATLTGKGFDVVSAASVAEALKLITTETFDVLITDLHMPNPSDGFAVITAMRHAQPDVLTLLVSGYPDVQSAMDAILLEADDIIVKPFEAGKLAEMVHEKLLTRKPSSRTPKERVAAILQRCTSGIVENWLTRVKKNTELNHVSLTDKQRTGYLPKLIEDLIVRLTDPNTPRGRKRFRLFRRRRSPWQDAKTARLHSRDAGARLTNTASDPVRDAAEQSKCFGLQLAFTRCHDYSG